MLNPEGRLSRLGARAMPEHDAVTMGEWSPADAPPAAIRPDQSGAVSSVDDDVAWQASAACDGLDPELFFPERGESTAKAKAVCAACPVREQCLEYALTNGEKFGIWGGLSERERRRLRRERGGRRLAECGTRSGYERHRYRDEVACADCLAANAAWHRARRGVA